MKLWDKLLNLLFPPRCVFCHRAQHEVCVCPACEASLPHRPVGERSSKVRSLDDCVTPLWYEGVVRSAALRYKFGGLHGNSVLFAELMADAFRTELFGKVDLITWVPISRRRMRRRGFDQAELLARELGKLIGLTPVRTLKKIRDNKPQSRQSTRAGRVANVIGAYKLADTSVRGKSVLIVDDIVTTGSTISQCAQVLREGGAQHVYGIALAKTRKNTKKD